MVRTVVAIAALVIGQIIVWPCAKEFMEADTCRQAGGSFDYEANRCDFEGRHSATAVWERYGGSLAVGGALSLAGVVLLVRRRK